jgi:hypothetical protein
LIEELKKEKKEYEEFVNEEFDEEDEFSDQFGENDIISFGTTNISDINLMKKFKVYFYINLNQKHEYNFFIESDLLNINNQYGYDLIKNIIKKINNESLVINNDSKNFIMSLKDCENEDDNFYINNFELRKCKKKTLKPNKELPPFSSKLLLNSIIDDNISLICKNNIYIMLIEKYNDIDEKKYDNDGFFENHEQIVNKIKDLNQKINEYNYKYEKYDDYKCNSCLII